MPCDDDDRGLVMYEEEEEDMAIDQSHVEESRGSRTSLEESEIDAIVHSFLQRTGSFRQGTHQARGKVVKRFLSAPMPGPSSLASASGESIDSRDSVVDQGDGMFPACTPLDRITLI